MSEASRAANSMRLDKFLWFARLTKTRSAAQAIAASGHLRLDHRPVDRAHIAIRAGQVITFPLGPTVKVLRINALPTRRGPASEARACYVDLTGSGEAVGGME